MAKRTIGCITKFLGAGNTRGSRIQVTMLGTGAKATVNYRHEFGQVENHEKIAEGVLGTKDLVMNDAPSGNGYVFLKR